MAPPGDHGLLVPWPLGEPDWTTFNEGPLDLPFDDGTRCRDDLQNLKPKCLTKDEESPVGRSRMKLRPRSLDQDLDHQNIWLWIQACNARHAERCIVSSSTNRHPSQVPDWVIDTTAACLVPGTAVDRYVALSYVWPSLPTSPAEILLLERDSLADFQTPGFLSKDCNISKIPQVIQDGIRLAQGFGERFVWIDRLCLMQNDHETYTQVQRMHEIYWGAYVTIIAAASGSLYGREDCCQLSNPDLEKDNSLPHHNDVSSWSNYHLELMREHYARLSRSKWGTRGWTYQEKILSKRTIILLDDDIFWDCQCALWDCNGLDPFTETNQQAGEEKHDPMNMRLTPNTSMDFGLYVELVCPYNARDLSYARDVIPAFTGILNTLAPAFPDGFVAGMPLAYMANMLLWQPRRGAVRRQGTSNPSWSWTGWRCEIDPWSLRSGLSRVTDQPSAIKRAGSWMIRQEVECVVVSPQAAWHAVGGKTRPGKVEVQKNGTLSLKLSNSEDSLNLSDPVTFGIVPKGIPPSDTLLFVQTSSAFFSVLAKDTAFQEPCEADLRFRKIMSSFPEDTPMFAIPTPEGVVFGSSTSSSLFGEVADSSTVAIGSISKVSVYESSSSASGDSADEGISLILKAGRDKFAGVIRVLDDYQLPDFETVELIALSLGNVKYRDLDAEWEERWQKKISESPGSASKYEHLTSSNLSRLLSLDDEPLPPNIAVGIQLLPSQPFNPVQTTRVRSERLRTQKDTPVDGDEIYEFYNVLLIEHQGDIVYRRGCGRVAKKAWERNALPVQRFILG